MRKLVLVAGLAAAAFIPSFAFAQSSCEQQRDNRVVGTVAGAGIGALVGSAIAPRHDRGAGAIIGAIGGGVIGNQVTRPDADCAHAYGYYDRDSQWHANATPTVMARGYYDRDGAWVDGAPNGYYDHSGRWMASNASGYYDQGGRWVAGSASGAYDVNGHWMPGAVNGHRDGSGVWVADAQPGYYDTQRHWRAGPVQGHYDDGGVWIPASTGPMYGGGMNHHDVRAREAWMEQRIRTAASNGDLSHHDARRALSKLSSIRQQDANMRDGSDRLSPQEDAMLQARLDRLKTSLGLRQDDQSTF